MDASGSLHITVAGVGKSIGAKELASRGGIKAFKEGFTFYKAGGTESVYNDKPEIKSLNIGLSTIGFNARKEIKNELYILSIPALKS